MKAYVLQEVVDTISRNLGGNGVRQLEGSHEEVLLQAIEARHGTEHDRGVQGLLHEDRLQECQLKLATVSHRTYAAEDVS